MHTPAVTVIIPNYNHQRFLRERIESVLQQTFTDFEVVIMDDRSTDESRELIDEYRGHEKVRIVYNEVNSGSTFNQWNKGVDLARAPFVWIAESDDVADPKLLETLMPALVNDPEVVLSYCQSLRIDAQSEVFGDWLFHTDGLDKDLFRTDILMDGMEYIERFLIYRNTIPNVSAVVFRKQAYLNAGGADANTRYVADWLLYLKMLQQGKVFYSHLMLNSFRYVESGGVIHSSGAGHSFVHHYDILMRFTYRDFLRTLTPFPTQLHHKNLKLLRKASRKEFKFLWRKRSYIKSLGYLRWAAFTS